jgi:hypothetical protein
MLFDDDGDPDFDDFEDIAGGMESVGLVVLGSTFEAFESSVFSWHAFWSAGEDGDEVEFTDSRQEPSPEPEPEPVPTPEPKPVPDAGEELDPFVSLIESLLTSVDKFPTG